ncbi:MAG: glycosyltransferase family 61 protein [Lysobacterales bacterium]
MPSRLSLFARAGAFEKRTELRIPGLASCIGAGGSLLRKHYHVLVDALPRLYWLQQLPAAEIAALTLCVSHQLGRYEDLLRALLPVGVQLRYVDDDCWIAADRYLLLPQLSMSSCGALPVGYTAQLQAFGARFAGMTGQPARRRLFISRQQASMRRISNFDQLAPLLQAHGVEVVALETLSVAAQAALFHAAELVISAHGAGLSNLLFASSARVIELAAAEPRPHYRCLCTAMGHDYRSVVVHDGGKNDDFELPSARLAALLKELDEEPAKPIRTQASSA